MKKRMSWSLIPIVLLLLTATGCGFQPINDTLSASGSAEEAFYEEREVEQAAEAPEADGSVGERGAGAADAVERMVIRTANLDLTISETEQAIEEIQSLADELDGYVVSLNTHQYQEGLRADVTLRVPAESFDAALGQLRDLAVTVRSESISGQDVTRDYVNLQADLRHLEAKEAQLLEFLDEAEDTEAVLAVYDQLSQTQQEIERVTGEIRYIENQTDLATIRVNLTPDALAQPLEVSGWNLSGAARDAVEALLSVLEVFVKGLIYTLIVLVPTLILIAIPIVLAVLLVRWVIRRRRARK